MMSNISHVETSLPVEVIKSLLETKAGSTVLFLLILAFIQVAPLQAQTADTTVDSDSQAIVIPAVFPTIKAVANQEAEEEIAEPGLSFHVYNQLDYRMIPMPGETTVNTPQFTLAEHGCGIFAFTHIRSFFEDDAAHPFDQATEFFGSHSDGIAMRVVADQLRSLGYTATSLPAMSAENMQARVEDGTYTLLLIGIDDEDHPRGHMIIAFADENGTFRVVDSEGGATRDSLPQGVSGAYAVNFPQGEVGNE